MKIKYMLLALMPLCIASCSDEEIVSPAGNGQEVRVTAGVGSHSRMVLNDQGTYTESLWQNGDCISLFTATQSNLTYSTAIEDSAATAEFTATDESLQYIEGNTVYACYPEVTATEENNLIVNLPTTDSFDYNNGTVRSFCYAVDKIASGSLNFKFKHLSAFLCLTVTPDMLTDATKGISTVTVTTSATEPLSVGEGDTFDFTTQTASTTNGSNTVQVNVDNRVVDAEWTVYVPILPQPAGADITVTLADSDGTTLYTLIKQTPENGFLAGYVYKQGASTGFDTSYLIDGPTFNASIKQLVNDVVVGRATAEVDSLNSLPDSFIAKVEFLTEVQTLPEKYITVSAENSPAPVYASFNPTDSLLTVFTPAKDIEVVDASRMFCELRALRTIDFGNFDVNETTTDTNFMFLGCSSLNSLDVSNWDTSSVTDMYGMFDYCSSLSSLDVSNWDTSNVTDMCSMFESCSSLGSLDVSNWDTSNVTDMGWMFYDCSSLSSLDVSNWNTEKVTRMYSLFCYCSSLTDLDVSRWDTGNVTQMCYTFANCSSLTTLDVSNWNTSNVTTMAGIFEYNSSLTTLDVSKWNTANVTTMYSMFFGCSALTTLDVSQWNTSNVTDMMWLFRGCSSLANIDVSNWDTGKVQNMRSLFYECFALTSLDVSNWNTESVVNMMWTFSYCPALTSVDVSNWNTSNVMTMHCMFQDCSSLTTLDVSNWDTSNVETMDYMFNICSSLTNIDVSKWNTANVNSMAKMFQSCSSLTTLNVADWNIDNVSNISDMFRNCSSFTELDISNWNFNDYMNIDSLFYYCASTSQACEITATQEAQDFLLARTSTTKMNPDWFIWTNGVVNGGGSSFDEIPKEEWTTTARSTSSRSASMSRGESREVHPDSRGSRGEAPDKDRRADKYSKRHHLPSSFDDAYRTRKF